MTTRAKAPSHQPPQALLQALVLLQLCKQGVGGGGGLQSSLGLHGLLALLLAQHVCACVSTCVCVHVRVCVCACV